MIKFAIIDSGLNSVYMNNHISGGATFQFRNSKLEILKNKFNDDNGHGSMVFKTIYQKCDTGDKFYIIKVLDKNNRGSSELLFEALKWLLHIELKYIVICISTSNDYFAERCQEVIDKLICQGKIIFSSWSNNSKVSKSYPAMLDNVISVGRGKLCTKKVECDFNNDVQCIVDIDPSYIWIPDKGFKVFGGNSQATADFVTVISEKLGWVENLKDFKQKVLLVDFQKESRLCEYSSKSINNQIMRLYEAYTGSKSTVMPFWKVFPTVSSLSSFLEEVCYIMGISVKEVVFKKSMFNNILLFSEAVEQIRRDTSWEG